MYQKPRVTLDFQPIMQSPVLIAPSLLGSRKGNVSLFPEKYPRVDDETHQNLAVPRSLLLDYLTPEVVGIVERAVQIHIQLSMQSGRMLAKRTFLGNHFHHQMTRNIAEHTKLWGWCPL